MGRNSTRKAVAAGYSRPMPMPIITLNKKVISADSTQSCKSEQMMKRTGPMK
ncbi:hypothetical protein D3C80_1779720 [compost metagenome]